MHNQFKKRQSIIPGSTYLNSTPTTYAYSPTQHENMRMKTRVYLTLVSFLFTDSVFQETAWESGTRVEKLLTTSVFAPVQTMSR